MQRKLWQQDELEILKQYYGKIPTIEIAKLLNNRWDINPIWRKAKLIGLNGSYALGSTKYSSDTTFFHEPNIQNCYWAGYIAADGSLKKKAGLSLSCAVSDRELIDNFVLQTKTTNPINIIPIGEKEICGNICICEDQARVDMWCQWQWKKDFAKYWNITARKSLTLQPPQIQDLSLIYAYIIGYFDGDGWISRNKEKRKTGIKYELGVGFCAGDPSILEWIKHQLMVLCPNESWDESIFKCKGSTYKISWDGPKGISIHKSLREVVDIPWKLKRKWEVDYSEFKFVTFNKSKGKSS